MLAVKPMPTLMLSDICKDYDEALITIRNYIKINKGEYHD